MTLPVRRVVVLGGGSAGFLAAITLKMRIPQLEVTVLRSKEIGIIGVGEGTTNYVPEHLHGYLGIPVGDVFADAMPLWKLGVRFLWGPRPVFHYPFTTQVDRPEDGLSQRVGYYCDEDFAFADRTAALMAAGRAFSRLDNGAPRIERNFAYHFENERFVAFLEKQAARVGVIVREATVRSVDRDDSGISALHLESGAVVTADLYVDCSGFRSALLGEALGEPFESFGSTLFCDRAIVGGWTRGGEPVLPYTTAETMNAGWCWQIEHEHRINRGYVYSSAFVGDDEAEREVRAHCPKVVDTRVVRFTSGSRRRAWVGNVVGIGNAAGFVEPLEATALFVICAASQALTASLLDSNGQPDAVLASQFNAYCARLWGAIRNFLAVHYRFNTRVDSPFWRACRADVDLSGAAPIVDYYRAHGPSSLWADTLIDPLDPFRLDGYFTMLIGQQVPYERRWTAPAAEIARWRQVRATYADQARTGFTIDEALRLVRSPQGQWSPGFFRV